MNGKTWTTKEIAILREMYEDLYHAEDIAERLGRSVDAVRLKARRLNLKVRGYEFQKMILTDKQEKRIHQLYIEEKKSLKETAELMNVSKSWVYDYFKKRGLIRSYSEANRMRKVRTIPFPELYKAYYEDCLRLEDMIKLWKCDHRVIDRSLQKYGLTKMRYEERVKMRDEFKDTGKLLNRTADWSKAL